MDVSVAPVALASGARPLLLLHAVMAMALAGASTHLLLVCSKLLRRVPVPVRLVRVYGQVTGVLYWLVFGWGLLIYPTYRYYVRGLYLDRYEPWASNLFDMKENLAALGLPLAAALVALARRLQSRIERDEVPVLAVLALAVWALVVFATLSGLLVTCVKGV